MASALGLLQRRARFGLADVGLAVLVVAVVAMMIVPLPTWLLDILLATNLSVSVAILLVVLYVPDALAIATFPTVLLLTTLYRLALNVSSSRLILLQALESRDRHEGRWRSRFSRARPPEHVDFARPMRHHVHRLGIGFAVD